MNSYTALTLTSAPATNYWTSVACSADGTVMVAGTIFGGVHTSTNSGQTWTLTSAPTNRWFFSVASSADGRRLAAAAGAVYTSTNSGETWTLTSAHQVNSGTQVIASSADGSRLVYAIKTSSGQTLYAIYTSTDSGATWVSNTVSKAKWTSVASSADGSKLVAAASGDSAGRIYTWEAAAVLDLAAAGTNLVLSWPALSATTGFGLQQNSDLTTTDWTDVTNTPTVTNGQNQVVLSPPASPLFYRLVSK